MPGEQTLRSDARANRARILESARELFAAEGLDVPIDEIRRRAGVGAGTFYRHFPTKDDLVDAVLETEFDAFLAVAGSALADPDAWRGFCSFFEGALALHAANRGLKDVVEASGHGRERSAAFRRRIRTVLAQLVERAKEDGSLRADFTAEDVPLVFWGCDRVIDLCRPVAPDVWRRQLGFVLDGLRAGAATPLPGPSLTRAQLARVAP